MKFICPGMLSLRHEMDEASGDPGGLSWQVIHTSFLFLDFSLEESSREKTSLRRLFHILMRIPYASSHCIRFWIRLGIKDSLLQVRMASPSLKEKDWCSWLILPSPEMILIDISSLSLFSNNHMIWFKEPPCAYQNWTFLSNKCMACDGREHENNTETGSSGTTVCIRD